ncbi:unnamed protein product [Adineta steineri]|uniref:F-box domain-containing protein n=1 Tax=Adineta steineri TaxID=433720 RepID=A0A813VXA3_9BILA|nr:unnamed protein product [Adineta steineri]CAF3988932.1 unnamed protein product [Adineta steineri]
MNFELLANELILDIFEYLNSTQLLRAYHGLNIRLNNLLYLHFQNYSLDFRSVIKKDFNDICQNILPLLTHQITSIHLSNDDDTPDQPNLFLSFGFHFRQFSNLQSLSLHYIRSMELMNKILSNCPQLISLNISKCTYDDDFEQSAICLNTIWSLKKLKSCYLDIESWNNFENQVPIIISSSLQILSIEHEFITLNCLNSLFICTPNLHDLKINITDKLDNEELLSFNIPSLTKLKIYFESSLFSLKNLLKNLPNLSQLIIQIDDIWIDGYQWEDIIRNYFNNVKIFQLLMFHRIHQDKIITEEIDYLIESFQTRFWLEQRQCFVRCDYHSEFGTTYLYTLPYGFCKFNRLISNMSKSTCSTDKISTAFNYVNNLLLDYDLIEFASKFPIQFLNIHSLDLAFPFNDVMWTVLPKFDRLTSLEIVSIAYSDENYRPINHLQTVLDRSIHLYSLTIDYLILSELSTVQINNKSIRRLDLISNDGHYYGSECISLIQSILGNQCEILLISIENRTIVLELIEKMSNLRALTFVCQTDQMDINNESSSSAAADDELFQWLKHHLPSYCTISRDENETAVVQLWIR